MTKTPSAPGMPSPIEGKIFTTISILNHKEGIKLFFQNYSKDELPNPEFVNRCFVELNRLGANQEAYELLQAIVPWFEGNDAITESFELAKRIYYDHCLVKGNELMEQARNKARIFDESISDIDSMRRSKVTEENEKTLQAMYRKACDSYQKAIELNPGGVGALTALIRCCGKLGMPGEALHFQEQLQDITEKTFRSESFLESLIKDRETEIEEHPREPEEKAPGLKDASSNPEMERFQSMFATGRYAELARELETFVIANPGFIPAILLRAQTHLALREFNAAQEIIDEAKVLYSSDNRVVHFQIEFLEQKLAILERGSQEFMSKGLQLGSRLGKSAFEKAERLLLQGLAIRGDDLVLLDRLFTCCMYLGKPDRAEEIKRAIYRVSPNFRPTFMRKSQPSLCFLADFAMPDDAHRLEDFRRFRRNHLLPTALGRRFLRVYSHLGPALIAHAGAWSLAPTLFRPPLCAFHAVLHTFGLDNE